MNWPARIWPVKPKEHNGRVLERLLPPDRPPTGWRRLLLRSPVYLYRIGLGRLFGHRMLVIIHRGRRSGNIYRTPVEVASYDPATDESIVPSGWGPQADWYRNIQASPAIEIWLAGRRFRPEQRFLSESEAATVMADYARRHPRGARELTRWMLGRPYDNAHDAGQALSAKVPFVGFRPASPP